MKVVNEIKINGAARHGMAGPGKARQGFFKKEIMKTTITLFLILFLAGCSCWHPDNRVRIKPEYSRVNHVDYDALRLAVLRELYCQRVLREYE